MKKILSLFSGCGGMDLGFVGGFEVHENCVVPGIHRIEKNSSSKNGWIKLSKNNYELVFANDILNEAKNSYVPYFSQHGHTHPFYVESIVDLVERAERNEFQFPDADIVIGGFPCQDFSVAGKRLGLNSDKCHTGELFQDEGANTNNRGMLYIWMKKVVELTQPHMFIAENVRGLVSLGDVKKIIEHDFRNIGEGYIVQDAKVLKAANYGVPQSRERVFFIGFNKKFLKNGVEAKLRSGEIDPYPPITHYLPNQEDEVTGLKKYVSLRDILKDLPEPEEAKDLSQRSYSKARFYGKHVQGQTEIKLDSIGPTIRAEHHGNIEFRRLSKENGGLQLDELDSGLKERRLTVRECARIQTFPDDYQFVKARRKEEKYPVSASGAYRVIGNAVPPLLAYSMAIHLENIWDDLFGADG